MDRKYRMTFPGTAAALLMLALTGALSLASPSAAAAQTSRAAETAEPAEPGGGVIQRALESRTKGNPQAEVVVFEIADFQCPFCARFAGEVAPALDEEYVRPGRIQWVFVNMPLHTHARAWIAAEAALCAGVAGDAFWPMHHRLFREQRTWSDADDPAALFEGYAREAGVPLEEYRACVDQDQVASLILQDLGSSVSAGVNGTPTFIIMKGQQVVDRLVGVQSPEEWATILEEALQ